MSDYEIDRHIHGEISGLTGELLISSSDMLGWLRQCAELADDIESKYFVTAICDKFASNLIDATRPTERPASEGQA